MFYLNTVYLPVTILIQMIDGVYFAFLARASVNKSATPPIHPIQQAICYPLSHCAPPSTPPCTHFAPHSTIKVTRVRVKVQQVFQNQQTRLFFLFNPHCSWQETWNEGIWYFNSRLYRSLRSRRMSADESSTPGQHALTSTDSTCIGNDKLVWIKGLPGMPRASGTLKYLRDLVLITPTHRFVILYSFLQWRCSQSPAVLWPRAPEWHQPKLQDSWEAYSDECDYLLFRPRVYSKTSH